jgi:hypothetical protein
MIRDEVGIPPDQQDLGVTDRYHPCYPGGFTLCYLPADDDRTLAEYNCFIQKESTKYRLYIGKHN